MSVLRFHNLSIRNKLMGVILLVALVPLILGFIFVILNDILSLKRDMISRTELIAQIIGEYCVGPIAFGDKNGGADILRRLNNIPSIINAAVYDTSGQTFASYGPALVNNSTDIGRTPSARFIDRHIIISQSIHYNDEFYGSIVLRGSTQSLMTKINESIRFMVFLSIGVIVVTILLALRFQGLISGPILKLADMTGRVSDENNYALRIQKTGDDEIGILYDGFNDMLDQIQTRERERDRAAKTLRKRNAQLIKEIGVRKAAEEELLQYREHLEELVDTRTQELTETNQHLRDAHAQLVQSSKMASLGQLVAGIAHEINTPIGAVSSMLDTLFRSVERLVRLIHTSIPEDKMKTLNFKAKLDILENAQKVIRSGTERVVTIVRRLRSFARLDEAELKTVDIHEGLEDTLTLIHHEIKNNITVQRHFGEIPLIACFPGQLNQVFLNILINAKQSIEGKGEITITTGLKDSYINIAFQDTGRGIQKKDLTRIFDPGFTTKGVGVGTGLGLSICYQIIEAHKGMIRVESELGKGSTFTISIPANLNQFYQNGTIQQRDNNSE